MRPATQARLAKQQRARLDRHIDAIVAEAPALTDEQKSRLTSLLFPSGASAVFDHAAEHYSTPPTPEPTDSRPGDYTPETLARELFGHDPAN
jgi:hypothetical protein